MAVWPDKFVVLRDDFQDVPSDRVIRSDMDVGPAKLRRRAGLKMSTLIFSMMLSNEVYQEFKDFYYENDVSVFDFKRPDTNTVVHARFSSAPSATMNETVWYVSVNLEILP